MKNVITRIAGEEQCQRRTQQARSSRRLCPVRLRGSRRRSRACWASSTARAYPMTPRRRYWCVVTGLPTTRRRRPCRSRACRLPRARRPVSGQRLGSNLLPEVRASATDAYAQAGISSAWRLHRRIDEDGVRLLRETCAQEAESQVGEGALGRHGIHRVIAAQRQSHVCRVPRSADQTHRPHAARRGR
jgi:hypothetical protein